MYGLKKARVLRVEAGRRSVLTPASCGGSARTAANPDYSH